MRRAVWMLAGLVAVGCATPAPPTERPMVMATKPTPPAESIPSLPKIAPVVALVEPYLVAVEEPKPLVLPPPSLRGTILPPPSAMPLTPAPPTQTVPIAPPVASAPFKSVAPTPKASRASIPPAVVRLLEDERARSVEDARQRLTAATTRATGTAAEAKRQWGFVKDGFVAQKTAESADATARDAAKEQADAQKALDAAQQRQRDARRDLQAAYGAVAIAEGFETAALETPLPAYRPVPFTYRLSLLGEAGKPTVENGTLGRSLAAAPGEGGAWIVRCVDLARLRIKVGAQAATVVTHRLPSPSRPKEGHA